MTDPYNMVQIGPKRCKSDRLRGSINLVHPNPWHRLPWNIWTVHSGLFKNNFKDEIRRIQRTFLNYAGLVPYAKRLKRVDSICRRDRDLIRGHGKTIINEAQMHKKSGLESLKLISDISYNIANLPKEALRNIIVDDKLRILYCSVPGVASSSFRQLFHDKGGALISPKKNSSNLDSFKRLHQYPSPQRQYMIRNFFKVCETSQEF